MVSNVDVINIMAKCFVIPEDREWEQISSQRIWPDFLTTLKTMLREGITAEVCWRPFQQEAALQDYLNHEEISALFSPPSYLELKAFSRRHFIGGMPTSAMPVESLHHTPTAAQRLSADPVALTSSAEKPSFNSEVALYMRDLISSLGLTSSDLSNSYPDHLSIELEVLSYLVEQKSRAQAELFLVERFAWLTTYRQRLLALGQEARFHLAIVDALLDIRALALNADEEQTSMPVCMPDNKGGERTLTEKAIA